MQKLVFVLILFIYSIQFIFSQSFHRESEIVVGGPKIKIECGSCDNARLKRSLNFVNFVRDIQSAEIFIKVTSQSTGTGQQHKIYFEGQDTYQGLFDTLYVTTESDDTYYEKNDVLIQSFKRGLLPYLLKSPLRDKIEYELISGPSPIGQKLEISDPWNYWVFSINMSGNFDGESNYKNLHFRTGLHASRKTLKSKLNFSYYNSYSESNFYFRDENEEIIDSQTIRSFQKNQSYWGGYVYGLNNNWSVSLSASGRSNSFDNFSFSGHAQTGIEYNIFPYEQSDQQMFVISYQIGPYYNNYVDSTIYDKKSQWLGAQSLEIYLSQNQKWGNLSLSSGFSNYLHDFKLNRLTFNPRVNWNVFKGFTLGFSSYLSFINDQINLPKNEANIPDVLLRDKLLATNYNLHASLSIRYSFGSQFANVVNPRFWGRGG